MNRPRPDHKEFCRSIAPAGFAYSGFDAPHYCFQTGDYRTGFREVKALDEDLTRDNLALMARLGVTRT